MTAPVLLCVRRSRPTESANLAVEVSLRLPSSVDLVEEAVNLITRHCLAGVTTSRRARFALQVALSEALANAILRGNGEDPAKTVEVRAELLPDQIHLHVTDEGPGFDPACLTDPIGPDDLERADGRGLFLIRSLVDHVSFNDRGNSICLTLRRR